MASQQADCSSPQQIHVLFLTCGICGKESRHWRTKQELLETPADALPNQTQNWRHVWHSLSGTSLAWENQIKFKKRDVQYMMHVEAYVLGTCYFLPHECASGGTTSESLDLQTTCTLWTRAHSILSQTFANTCKLWTGNITQWSWGKPWKPVSEQMCYLAVIAALSLYSKCLAS